jgi:hypothetical protein
MSELKSSDDSLLLVEKKRVMVVPFTPSRASRMADLFRVRAEVDSNPVCVM